METRNGKFMSMSPDVEDRRRRPSNHKHESEISIFLSYEELAKMWAKGSRKSGAGEPGREP